MSDEAQVSEQVGQHQTPKEWLDHLCAEVLEATGNALFETDSKTYQAALVLVTILEVGPRTEDLMEATGYLRNTIARIKHNMIASGLLISHQGCRTPKIQYADWDGDDGWIAFLMDSMAAAGTVGRAKADAEPPKPPSYE